MLDAYRLAVGTRDDLRRAMLSRAPGSPERALLEAVIAQYDGDDEAAVRKLRRQLQILTGWPLGAVADTLAPILVMRHDAGDFTLLDFLMGSSIDEVTQRHQLASRMQMETVIRAILLCHGYSAEPPRAR